MGDLSAVRICNYETENALSSQSHIHAKVGRILRKKRTCQKQKQFFLVCSPFCKNALGIHTTLFT